MMCKMSAFTIEIHMCWFSPKEKRVIRVLWLTEFSKSHYLYTIHLNSLAGSRWCVALFILVCVLRCGSSNNNDANTNWNGYGILHNLRILADIFPHPVPFLDLKCAEHPSIGILFLFIQIGTSTISSNFNLIWGAFHLRVAHIHDK